jgi:hypothetical protein
MDLYKSGISRYNQGFRQTGDTNEVSFFPLDYRIADGYIPVSGDMGIVEFIVEKSDAASHAKYGL